MCCKPSTRFHLWLYILFAVFHVSSRSSMFPSSPPRLGRCFFNFKYFLLSTFFGFHFRFSFFVCFFLSAFSSFGFAVSRAGERPEMKKSRTHLRSVSTSGPSLSFWLCIVVKGRGEIHTRFFFVAPFLMVVKWMTSVCFLLWRETSLLYLLGGVFLLPLLLQTVDL